MNKVFARIGNTILLKPEDRQLVHSFKLHGAYTMITGLTDEQKASVKAKVVMPIATADIKVDTDANPNRTCVFVKVRLNDGDAERLKIIKELQHHSYEVTDLSDDEMSKLHVRYMISSRPSKPLNERPYSFEFPESPGALLRFLETLRTH